VKHNISKNSGMTLLELVIASVILAVTSVAFFSYILTTKKTVALSSYNYVAINLARDVLEWGASGNFSHDFRLKYYYPGAKGCTISIHGDCRGAYTGVGYGLKEWAYFDPKSRGGGWDTPFDTLGDIKAKGLVPPENPDSVVIYYETRSDPAFYGKFKHYVSVSWQDTPNGPVHKRDLATISLSHVNDQLHLKLADFTWK